MTLRLYRGTITHGRTTPLRHAFTYPAAMVGVDLATLEVLDRRKAWLRYNRRSILWLDDRDYLTPTAEPIRAKLAACMPGFDHARTVLLTSPRSWLPSFNPITAYFAYDAGGTLTGFAAEVSNTYGERYFYRPEITVGSDGGFTARVPKMMYVSPFHGVAGDYLFKGHHDDRRAEIAITLEIEGRAVIGARLACTGADLASAGLATIAGAAAQGALALPRIYHQALMLRFKGLKPVMKPRPPVAVLRGGHGRR